jgi:hypothetical protein
MWDKCLNSPSVIKATKEMLDKHQKKKIKKKKKSS